MFAIWKRLPLQTCMHASTYIWYSFFTLQMGIKHRSFQNVNSLGCYSCLSLHHVYSLLPEWGDPKASLFLCSYQVDISTKSRSLSTTKKKTQMNSKCNKLQPLAWFHSKFLSKQSFLACEYSCSSDNMKGQTLACTPECGCWLTEELLVFRSGEGRDSAMLKKW